MTANFHRLISSLDPAFTDGQTFYFNTAGLIPVWLFCCLQSNNYTSYEKTTNPPFPYTRENVREIFPNSSQQTANSVKDDLLIKA